MWNRCAALHMNVTDGNGLNLPERVYVGSSSTCFERLNFGRHYTQCGEYFRCYVRQVSFGNTTSI